MNNSLFFIARDGSHGDELWILADAVTSTGFPVKENSFGIYPNPADDFIAISKLQPSGGRIELFDYLGRLAYFHDYVQSGFQLPTKDLQAGVYFLHVNGKAEKLVIQH